MNISIEIKAPELANAILALAAALGGKKESEFQQIVNQGAEQLAAAAQAPVQQAPVQQAPVQQQPNVVPFQQQTPAGVPTAPLQQAPVQQAPQGVPTSAPTYTMDQLAVAATQLMDAGRQQDLLALLSSFGAPSLMALPKEQYGAFATKLREMGARI